MDRPPQNHQDDDVFSDGLDDCRFLHHHDSPASPASAFTLSDPPPPPPSPPGTTLRRRHRRRSIPPPSSLTESADTASKSDLIDDAGTTFQSKHRQNLEISNEIEEDFPVKRDSNQEKPFSFPSPSVVTEERIEESTLTTAASDDALADSADSGMELVDSSSSSLQFAAGLVIWAIVFQIKIFIWLIKFPVLLTLHTCMFFLDPSGTLRRGTDFFTWILGRVSCCVFGCIGTPIQAIFKDQKTFWNVAFRCGWGFLWSICVCCILFVLVVSSVVFSGFVVKGLAEKPIQMKKVLNFDYTKQSPVAYVPIISCAGVDGGGGGGHDSEKDIADNKWVGQRILPASQKVRVTVSLVVPESGYNRNLGVFQIRADYLSSSGKTIASLSQPCMLKFRSEPIRLITTFLKIAPLITGFMSETQTLDVKIKGFVERDTPTSCLKVTLEQRAEYLPGAAGIPQIHDAFVVLESELPLFKRIIWHWKMSIFIWIAMTALMMQFLFVLVCCWPMIIPRTRQRRSSARRTDS